MSFADLVEIDTTELEKKEKEQEIFYAKKLATDTAELQLIMQDLNTILLDSNQQLIDTNENIVEAEAVIQETNQELIQAQKYQTPLIK